MRRKLKKKFRVYLERKIQGAVLAYAHEAHRKGDIAEAVIAKMLREIHSDMMPKIKPPRKWWQVWGSK